MLARFFRWIHDAVPINLDHNPHNTRSVKNPLEVCLMFFGGFFLCCEKKHVLLGKKSKKEKKRLKMKDLCVKRNDLVEKTLDFFFFYEGKIFAKKI